MAADATYPIIHRSQGTTELVFESGSVLDVLDGAQVKLPVVTDTTAANMSNFGVSSISNASSALSTFILDAPVPGALKVIKADASFGSSAIGYIDAGSGVTIGTTNRYMRIQEASVAGVLIGMSTSAWALIGTSSTGMSISTGSTA